MNNFIKLNRRSDYISFVEDMRDFFECPEEWENFFGFCLECDDDGNELEDIWSYSKSNKFETEPLENEYPVVVYCNIDNSADRFGNFDIRIFDYIPMKNLAVNGLR